MRFFVKAIATGFAMSMGSAIFKKVSGKMGLDGEGNGSDSEAAAKKEAATDSASEDEDSASEPERPPEEA